jgi:class 3 adenylate cyclase
MHLRIGILATPPKMTHELDVCSHGVNRVARLTAIARPSAVVVSADVRYQLTLARDADIGEHGE